MIKVISICDGCGEETIVEITGEVVPDNKYTSLKAYEYGNMGLHPIIYSKELCGSCHVKARSELAEFLRKSKYFYPIPL